MSSAQVKPVNSTLAAGPIRESASFAAHLKTLERKIPLRSRYENFIGGEWIAPLEGGYFDNVSPTTGQVICQIARSQADEGFAGLKLQVNLIADEAVQSIDFVAVVGGGSNSGINRALRGKGFRPSGGLPHRHRKAKRADTQHLISHACAHRVSLTVFSPATSGSERKSKILKPKGFQRRVFGSLAASP